MTKQETINTFHLYMDDTSDLSTQEESDLYDRVLQKIYMDRPWEFLKKEKSDTTSTTLPYISLPTDFVYLTQNHNYSQINEEASGPVIFVGAGYSPYKVVSWSDRRQYRNQDGYAFIDIVNRRLYFAQQPTQALPVEYDYHFLPTALTPGQSPVFPVGAAAAGDKAIFHAMCVDSFVIQQSDKARSYASENQALHQAAMAELAFFNANLIQEN